jgi:multiple sugar transport system substrate-binding protein
VRTAARLRCGLAAAACLLLAAACTGGPGAEPRPTSTGDGQIIVASGLDVTGKDGVRQQLIDLWNTSAEGVKHPARLVELPGDADQQRSQLLGALQSGSARYDVVNLDVTWVPEFADGGLITPIQGRVDPDIIPSVAGTGTWKNRTYAVPFNSDVGLLYYRPDYLADAGVQPSRYPYPGMSWDGLKALIRELETARDTLPSSYQKGLTTQAASYEGLTVNAIEAFSTAGVELADADGHYRSNPAELRKGLDALRDRAAGSYTLTGAVKSYEAESLSDFAAGKTAFLRHWPYAYPALARTLTGDRLKVAQLPGRAVLGGQDLAVSAASPRAKYALDLIRFLTSRGNERCLLNAGFAATRTSAYSDSGTPCPLPSASPTPSPAAGKGPTEAPGTSADEPSLPAYVRSVLLPALTTAVQRPRTPYYGAFTQALQAQVHPWLANLDAPDADKVAAGLDQALRKAFKGK